MKTMKGLIFLCILKLAVGQNNREPRIINGEDANEGEFPFMISIQPGGNFHECGGSILNENYILTAAHCVTAYVDDPYWYKVHVGLRQDKPDVIHEMETIHVHEGYIPSGNHENDIAIAKVKPPFVFNNKVGAVVLPEKNSVTPPGTKATLSGWGWTVDHPFSSPSPILQKLSLTVRSNSECESKLVSNKIYKEMICTLETSGEYRGPCEKDSGSPLTINKNVVIGVISRIFGKCGQVGKPHVYTRVSEYIDWINQHMK